MKQINQQYLQEDFRTSKNESQRILTTQFIPKSTEATLKMKENFPSIYKEIQKNNQNMSNYHKCPYCDKEFAQKFNLYKHQRVNHKIEPYSCQDCNLKFYSPEALKEHRKEEHADKPEQIIQEQVPQDYKSKSQIIKIEKKQREQEQLRKLQEENTQKLLELKQGITQNQNYSLLNQNKNKKLKQMLEGEKNNSDKQITKLYSAEESTLELSSGGDKESLGSSELYSKNMYGQKSRDSQQQVINIEVEKQQQNNIKIDQVQVLIEKQKKQEKIILAQKLKIIQEQLEVEQIKKKQKIQQQQKCFQDNVVYYEKQKLINFQQNQQNHLQIQQQQQKQIQEQLLYQQSQQPKFFNLNQNLQYYNFCQQQQLQLQQEKQQQQQQQAQQKIQQQIIQLQQLNNIQNSSPFQSLLQNNIMI